MATMAIRPGVHHEFGNFGNPADVLHPISRRKVEIPAQPEPDIVPVHKVRMLTQSFKFFLQQTRDRRFAGTRQARQPEDARLLMQGMCPRGFVDAHPKPCPDHGSPF